MISLTDKCPNPKTVEFMKSNFKPGAVIVSYGMRGGGKTHAAISFIQRMMEGYYPDMPEHIVLVTNVIFVKKTKAGMVQEAPPGVKMIHEMKELFPIVTELLDKYGRKSTMIVLLLDEAQNFLLGDMNSQGDMARAMKVFCGIIRKFNLCLWLISPAMRNLGPAFRNFLDADYDPGNVNLTIQKDTAAAKRYMNAKKLERDPRSFAFVQPGFHAKRQIISVPTSSWTRDPDTLPVGGYAYDHLSSADFSVGEFPFHDFVRYISGKSSYSMASAIKEFYKTLETDEGGPKRTGDGRYTERELVAVYYRRALAYTDKTLRKQDLPKIFGRNRGTLNSWAGIDTSSTGVTCESDTPDEGGTDGSDTPETEKT